MAEASTWAAPRVDRLAASARSLPLARIARRDAALALGAFSAVVSLAFAEGGYFPTAWGLAALAMLWALAVAVVAGGRSELGALEVVTLASLAVLTAWTGISALWSVDPARSILDAQRGLVYPAALALVLLFARRRSLSSVVAALTAAAAVVSVYALATRLAPALATAPGERRFDRLALSAPVGYSNALGLLAATGILLALGFAVRGRSRRARALAAAALVPLASTVYLSASRAAVVALVLGAAVAVSLAEERRLLAVRALAALPGPALAVWLCARAEALASPGAALPEGEHARELVALALALLAAASAALVLAAAAAPPKWRFGLAVALAVVLLAAGAAEAGPLAGAANGQRAGFAPAGTDGEGRLARAALGNRSQYWGVAWATARDHPVLGAGAGSFARSWTERRPTRARVRDAHNLYVETLAELGPVGLGLLLVTLGTPLVAARRARRHPLVPAVAGAYVAFLVHAGAHWNWEMPVLTVTALACGAVLLVAARRKRPARAVPPAARVLAVFGVGALIVFAYAGLAGNSALARAAEARAAGAGGRTTAEAQAAIRWLPWSGEPWRLLGEVAAARGDAGLARESFRRGLERDPGDWILWRNLASVTRGEEHRHARERAARLNPLGARAPRAAVAPAEHEAVP